RLVIGGEPAAQPVELAERIHEGARGGVDRPERGRKAAGALDVGAALVELGGGQELDGWHGARCRLVAGTGGGDVRPDQRQTAAVEIELAERLVELGRAAGRPRQR